MITFIALALNLWSVEFKKADIKVSSVPLIVEIADDEIKREQGLMNRKSLPDGQGMLFIFPYEQPMSFWMKNTLIPLSIGFFDKKGVLDEIVDMEPASPVELSPRTYVSKKPAKFALEVPQGWFKRKKINPGAKLNLPKDLSSTLSQSE